MGKSIHLNNVSYSYPNQKDPVLNQIKYRFETNTTTVLLGPNGIGKSTLLSMIIGYLHPSSGQIFFDTTNYQDIERQEMGRQIAYLPQIETAPIFLTVEEFIILGRIPYISRFASPTDKDTRLVNTIINELNLNHIRAKKMDQISGGELQLAFLARALSQEPEVLIMDEPMNHLDLKNQAAMIALIQKLQTKEMTIILTTHNPQIAAAIADQVLLFLPDGTLLSGNRAEMLSSENLTRVYQTRVDVIQHNGTLLFSW